MFKRKLNFAVCMTIVLIFVSPSFVFAKRTHPEWWYINQWCRPHGGHARAVLNDGTKCDCMTDDYVVEVEYANRWKNAVGKVLHYSLQTGKRSLIVLVLESPKDEIYYNQLKTLITYFRLQIDIWKLGDSLTMDAKVLPKQ